MRAAAGHVLKVGEDQKMVAHADACREVGVSLIQLVVESLGVGAGARQLSIPFPAMVAFRDSVWASPCGHHTASFSTSVHLIMEGQRCPMDQPSATLPCHS